jgi:RNA polymerase subunit RPABC4/transcription elongation factor Spt4
MQKKECPGCAMDIPEESNVCPVCQYEFPKTNSSFKWIALVLAIVLLLLTLLGFMNDLV